MKKLLLALAVAAVAVLLLTSGKTQSREATFQTNLHCKNCAAKIQDNVAFEKGVKDLTIDVDAKTVRIVYNPSKTNVDKLAEAIRKLGYTAELIEDKAL